MFGIFKKKARKAVVEVKKNGKPRRGRGHCLGRLFHCVR